MDRSLLESKKLDHRTPQDVIELIEEVGEISLDPAAHPHGIVPAAVKLFPRLDWRKRPDLGNGLAADWRKLAAGNLAYVNPPYGHQIGPWAEKIAAEAARKTEIMALVAARVDTAWFRLMVLARPRPAVCFWKGRIAFIGQKNGAMFPSALFYFGPDKLRFCEVFRPKGWIVYAGR